MQLMTNIKIPSLETTILPKQTSEVLPEQDSDILDKQQELPKKPKDSELLDESKEISDAILGIVEEGILESRVLDIKLDFVEQERQLYAALETTKKIDLITSCRLLNLYVK